MVLVFHKLILVPALWFVLFVIGVILLCWGLWAVVVGILWSFVGVFEVGVFLFVRETFLCFLNLIFRVFQVDDRVVIVIIPKLAFLLFNKFLFVRSDFVHFGNFLHKILPQPVPPPKRLNDCDLLFEFFLLLFCHISIYVLRYQTLWMLFGTGFFGMLGWSLFTEWPGLLWGFVIVPCHFSMIVRQFVFVFFVVLLVFAVEHGELWALFVLWDTVGNRWLLWFGVKLLFWHFHYLLLDLDVFWTVVSLLLLLFLFVLLFLFLHELIYFYHVFLCDFVDFEWLFWLAHILEGVVFGAWLFLGYEDFLDSRVLEGDDCFGRASHFFKFLRALFSWTLFGGWVGTWPEFVFIFMVLSEIRILFSLWCGGFGLMEVMFIFPKMKGLFLEDFDVFHGFGLFFSG